MDDTQAQRVLSDMADWRRRYERGGIRVSGPKLGSGEFYAAWVPFVEVLAPGSDARAVAPSARGDALATNDRLILSDARRGILSQWGWERVSVLQASPDWTGVVLIHRDEPRPVVLTLALPRPRATDDALRGQRLGWLEIEATHAAVGGQLARFFTALPARLATLEAP